VLLLLLDLLNPDDDGVASAVWGVGVVWVRIAPTSCRKLPTASVIPHIIFPTASENCFFSCKTYKMSVRTISRTEEKGWMKNSSGD
jgi:hypothetical protein